MTSLFLQKTFDMLESCPTNIAEWTNHGTSFAVKQVKAFEMIILPRYFKHNSFASFGRQLRFYGFEKIKKHEIRLNCNNSESFNGMDIIGAVSPTEGWWEFSHPKFLRYEPSKMAHIKRKTCTDPSAKWDKAEIVELKENMAGIQTKLSTLTKQIHLLTNMVNQYADQLDDRQPILTTEKVPVASPINVSDANFLHEFDDCFIDSLLMDASLFQHPITANLPLHI
jgi:hypothetical protein